MIQKEEQKVSVVRASRPIVVFTYILQHIPVWKIRFTYRVFGMKLTLKLFPARHVYPDDSRGIYGHGMLINNKMYILDGLKSSNKEATTDN